jgi:hypothetical protein
MAVVLLLVVVVGCWRGAIVCERFGLMSEVIRDIGGGLAAQVLPVQGSFLACIKVDNIWAFRNIFAGVIALFLSLQNTPRGSSKQEVIPPLSHPHADNAIHPHRSDL